MIKLSDHQKLNAPKIGLSASGGHLTNFKRFKTRLKPVEQKPNKKFDLGIVYFGYIS